METLLEIEDYVNEGTIYSTFTIKYFMTELNDAYYYDQ